MIFLKVASYVPCIQAIEFINAFNNATVHVFEENLVDGMTVSYIDNV